MKVIPIDKKWLEVPLDRWIYACRNSHKGIQDQELRGVLPDLYQHFPQPGKATHVETPVIIEEGKQIGAHQHSQWAMLYYVSIGDPPCAIIVDGGRVIPEVGSAILLEPGVIHSVELSYSVTPRLSIALRWKYLGDNKLTLVDLP